MSVRLFSRRTAFPVDSGERTSALLQVRGLVVERGGRRVLDIGQFSVRRAETVAVVGPNGAGKSTLLLAMAFLLRPTRGELAFDGTPVTPRRSLALRRRIGLVLADPLLLDTTVRKNVASGLRFRGVRGRQAGLRVDEWLDRLGILALRDRHARELSSGEAQRVSLARALVLDPEVLLLDEPFASVDVAARAQLVDDTERLLRETERACLLVTHDLDEAGRLGSRMAVVVNGRLRQEGAPQEVLAKPVDPEVAAFVGVETRLPGRLLSVRDGLGTVMVQEHRVEAVTSLSPDRNVLCCLRPEDVTLRPLGRLSPPSPLTSARNRLEGRIVNVASKGPLVHVTVDCGALLVAAVTKTSTLEMGLRPGDRVEASFKATALHLIGLPG
ncbi:ABC transporter ATP-binding protein [Streptomyces cavernae]|uniref:ABC transporter ATP-binding protein n=1 Tax=Streptomyces cavernae TaxID=2259034 RepID=UPI000FEB7C67|nr:ABC transporter ATP-binding protein [Streptomyces cavernae]